MVPPPPDYILDEIEMLEYRSIMICVLFLDIEHFSENASIYFPDKECPFTRIYEPKNRSEEMAPNEKTCIVVEIPVGTDKINIETSKDNVYNITVLVSDGNGSTSRDFIITVQQKNTKPVFRSLPSTILVPENSKKVYQILVGDGEGDNISYTLSGDDSDQFNLSSNGLISFKSTKDYEDSTKNKFNISITISDGSLTTTRSAIIMITDQDESQFGESSIGKTKLE